MAEWLTAQQAADAVGVHKKTFAAQVRDRPVTNVRRVQKPGRTSWRWMYHSDDVKEWKRLVDLGAKPVKESGPRPTWISHDELSRIVMYSPWTRAGLRELRI